MEVRDFDNDGSQIIAGMDLATVPAIAEQFGSSDFDTAPGSSAKKKKKVRVEKQFSQENNTPPTIVQSSSSSFGSYHVFGQRQSSSSAFAFHPVFGQTNSGNNPIVPKPFCSTSPFGTQCGGSIFGSTSTGIFGSQSSSPLGSSSIFGASSSPAFGSSAPTFGSSLGAFVFGQKPTFGRPFQQSQPAFGSNFFGSTAPFGVQSKPVFGSSSSSARSAPAYGSTSTHAFGSTSSAFGLSATTLGSCSPAFGTSSTPAFGATTAPAFDATKTPAFCATTAPTFHATKTPAFGVAINPALSTSSGSVFDASAAPAFGSSRKTFNFGSSLAFGQSTLASVSFPAFGAASNPPSSASCSRTFDASAGPAIDFSSTTFNFGSSPTVGQSTPASASAPASRSSSGPTFDASTAPALGFSSTTFNFGSSPAFSQSTLASSSPPASSVSSGHAFDASAAPAFGSSSTIFNFGSSPAFNQSTPVSANSPFATISFGAQSSSFGAQTTSITFGSASCPAFGMQNVSAFGGTSTPTLGSTASVVFGSKSCVFGLSTTTFGSSSPAFGASTTPAFGATSAPTFGATSAPTFGALPAPALDASSAPAFATSSTAFNFGSNPSFSQSTPVSTNSPFSTISFGTQSSSFGAQATSLTFGQSVFGEQRGGSRVSPYLATPKTDGVAATKHGKLTSISAIPVYKDKSHEQLRWEDYQLADKGGQAPTDQSTAAVGFGNSGIGSFWSAAFDQSPANLFASLTHTNPSAPIAPASNNSSFGFLPTSTFGSSPSRTSNTSDLFCIVSPVSTSLSGSTTQIIGVNTTSTSLFSFSGTSTFGSPSIFCPTSAAHGTPPAFSTGSSSENSQSSLFQSSIPAFTQTTSFGQTSSAFCGNLISSSASLQSDSNPVRFGQTNVPFFNDDEETPSTPIEDAAFVPRENPRALVISPLEQLPSRSSVEKTTLSKAMGPPVNENCISNCYIFKNLLYDYAQQQRFVKPIFETIDEGFPRWRSYRSTVIFNNVRYDSLPGFSDRKEADHSAAEVALIVLGNTPDVKIGVLKSLLKSGHCKTRLFEFARRMKYTVPVYECQVKNTIHSCVVEIGGVKYIGTPGKSKKEAEINAARTALLALESAVATVSEDDHTSISILTVIPNKKNVSESAFKELQSLHLKKHLKKLYLKRDCSTHQPIIMDNKLEGLNKTTAVKSEIVNNVSSSKRKNGDSSQDKEHIFGSEVNNINEAEKRQSSVTANITDYRHGLVGIIGTTHETDSADVEPKNGHLKKRQKLNCGGLKMDCSGQGTTMLSSDWIRQAGFVVGVTTDAAICSSQEEKSGGGDSNNNNREVIGLANNVVGYQVGTESGLSCHDNENVTAAAVKENEVRLMERREKNRLKKVRRRARFQVL